MDSSKIKALIIVVLALFFALYLGVASATESMKAILWMGGILGATTLLMLGRHVWILIPIFTIFEGFIGALPGSPDPWILAGAVVTGIYVIRFLTKREGFLWRWSLLDFAVLLQLLCVLQAWIRNPTGLMMMGGDEGGAKVYLVYVAAIFTYACLSITAPTVGAIKLATISRVVFGIVDGIILLLQGWFPTVAALGLRTYTSPFFGETSLGQTVNLDESRLSGGKYLGVNLITSAFCLARPVRCLIPIYIFPFLATVIGSGLILLSGFRSAVAYAVALFLMAAFVRRKPLDAVVAGFAGLLCVISILAFGQLDKLPFGIQRIFTLIGADVKSEQVLSSAEDSSNDRFHVWQIVMTQPGYIGNKLLGDGFSLSKAEHNALVEYQMGLRSFNFIDRCLTTGNYHGFHVSTIKYTGALGLFMAIFLMAVVFWRALNLIKYYRNTELFPYVLYACLPLMLYFPWSLFVYGNYKSEFPKFIIMAGMIKILENLLYQTESNSKNVIKKVPQHTKVALNS